MFDHKCLVCFILLFNVIVCDSINDVNDKGENRSRFSTIKYHMCHKISNGNMEDIYLFAITFDGVPDVLVLYEDEYKYYIKLPLLNDEITNIEIGNLKPFGMKEFELGKFLEHDKSSLLSFLKSDNNQLVTTYRINKDNLDLFGVVMNDRDLIYNFVNKELIGERKLKMDDEYRFVHSQENFHNKHFNVLNVRSFTIQSGMMNQLFSIINSINCVFSNISYGR